MIVAIIFIFVGILLTVMAGIVISRFKNIEDSIFGLLFCMALSIMYLCTGIFLMYQEGRSASVPLDEAHVALKSDNIYETLNTVEWNDEILVIVQRRDGKIFARKTKTMPPQVFKRIDNDENPYQPYP
jgi:ABC-type glycerol-3-phosphate transport system permease component